MFIFFQQTAEERLSEIVKVQSHLWKLKVYLKIPPLVANLKHMNSVHNFKSYFGIIFFHISFHFQLYMFQIIRLRFSHRYQIRIIILNFSISSLKRWD